MSFFAKFQAGSPRDPLPLEEERTTGVGQLYRLHVRPPNGDPVDVLWLTLFESAALGRPPWCVVACDQLTGFHADRTHDVILPDHDPAAPLVVRPGIIAWVTEALLGQADLVGTVTQATLDAAREAFTRVLVEPRLAPFARMEPDAHAYRAYIAFLVRYQARCRDHSG